MSQSDALQNKPQLVELFQLARERREGNAEDKIEQLTEVIRQQLREKKISVLRQAYKTFKSQHPEEKKFGKRTAIAKLLNTFLQDEAERDAGFIKKAIKGLRCDESTLSVVLVTRSNAELAAIKEAYHRLYNKDMTHDVLGKTRGDFHAALEVILQGRRSEEVDATRVEADVDALYKAGEGKLGTDEKVFISVMCTRSFPHIAAISHEYQQKYKNSLDKAISKEISGDLKGLLETTVHVAQNRPKFVAQSLHSAFRGLRTNDEMLRRIVSVHINIMPAVKQAYLEEYKKPLEEDITNETSGVYRKILLKLIDF